jgi:hypothetical protein
MTTTDSSTDNTNGAEQEDAHEEGKAEEEKRNRGTTRTTI